MDLFIKKIDNNNNIALDTLNNIIKGKIIILPIMDII